MTHSAMVRGIPEPTYNTIKQIAERDSISVNKVILKIIVEVLDKPAIMGTVRIDAEANPCLECGNTAHAIYHGRITMDGRIIGPYCESCI